MNQFVSARLRAAGSALCLALLGLTEVDAAVLAYEGFSYAPGSVTGQNGSLGWHGGWTDVGGGGNGVEFYSTPDFRNWTFRSKIYNGMFECPDIFQLPVDGNSNNLVWELNDASSGYQLGQFNGATFTPTTAELPGNLGSGYYASQTFTGMKPGDNRTVRIGWAQISTPGMPFNQLMYFPTALTLQRRPAVCGSVPRRLRKSPTTS